MAHAEQLPTQLGETVKARNLCTDRSICNSILIRVGPGRLKHLDASQLCLQEKTRSGELLVNNVLGTSNPTDAIAKFADSMTLERDFEKMGLLHKNCTLGGEVRVQRAGHPERAVAEVGRLHPGLRDAAGS